MFKTLKPNRMTNMLGVRGPVRALLTLSLCVVLSGCYVIAAKQDIDRDGSHPWWCSGPGTAYTDSQCLQMSAYFDVAATLARSYPTRADYSAAGAVAVGVAANSVGEAYSVSGAPVVVFDPMNPTGLVYEDNAPGDRVVGAFWLMSSPAAPAGFPGDHDVWTEVATDTWLLMTWVVRGYENHPNVFASGHPCLEPGVSLTSTADQCFLASHTVPLQILVTNDDGIGADGIDALVQGLKTVPGVVFDIVAPATQQSGQGGNTTPGSTLLANPGNTMSGDLGTAVEGFPADAVIYAIRDLQLSPDLTLSGINDGQNLASIGDAFSGTIGAARKSLSRGVPSIAISQGNPVSGTEFSAGVTASLALLEQWRLGNAGQPYMQLPNLNIPSCGATGTITGTIDTIVGEDLSSGTLNGTNYFGVQQCGSAKVVFADDLDAFLNGWTSIGDMGKVVPPNWP